MIDFTTEEMRNKHVDVRARITDGRVELIVKRGEWGGTHRAEYPVACQADQFKPLVLALVGMGITKGVGCRRLTHKYQDGRIEISIVEVPGHSYYYEAEIMTTADKTISTEAELKHWAEQRHLPIFTKEEFLNYVEELDLNANDQLDFNQPESFEILEKRLAEK